MTTKWQPNDNQVATIKIHDWEKWQTYRKDRGTPPWVKVHRNLMTSSKWAMLSDSDKGHLVSLWIAAADNGGNIPANPRVLKKICLLDEEPNIEKLINLGFLEGDIPVGCQHDVNMTSKRRQRDAPETETEAETELNTLSENKPKKQTKTKKDYSEEFKNLWSIYGKLNGAKKAYSYKVYQARKKKKPDMPPVEDIISSIKAQIKDTERKRNRGQFVPEWPHLSTWINQDRWTDEVTGIKTKEDIETDKKRKELHARMRAKGCVYIGGNKWMKKGGEIITSEADNER